jgi:hypothetical protein
MSRRAALLRPDAAVPRARPALLLVRRGPAKLPVSRILIMTNQDPHPIDQPANLGSDHPLGRAAGGSGVRLLTWPDDRVNLVLLFMAAWGLRVGLLAWGGLDWMGEIDGEGYYSEAVGLVEGRGIVRILPNGRPQLSAFHMPLTPLVLAGGMKVFGTSATVARMIAIAIGSLSAPLMYLIARTIMPRRWAVCAGLACAIHPTFLFYSIQTVSQPFYVPLNLLGVLLAVRALQRPGFATAFTDGVAWGLAALCRPQGSTTAWRTPVHRRRDSRWAWCFLRLGPVPMR